ncbi:uncharacterized protein LOC135392727 isoform X2 [Ornithodoros turicata]|uniref:uncharacterized protein LOC135392727 isoform X2 n=1 Tax=Ornithodoros turicata TaxID=34597 RepID=UPI00313872CD
MSTIRNCLHILCCLFMFRLCAPFLFSVQVHDAYFCLNSNDPMFQSRCCRCPQLTYRATLQRCVQRPACRGEHDPGHVHCGRVLSRHSILRGRKTASRCDLISGYNVACFSSM